MTVLLNGESCTKSFVDVDGGVFISRETRGNSNNTRAHALWSSSLHGYPCFTIFVTRRTEFCLFHFFFTLELTDSINKGNKKKNGYSEQSTHFFHHFFFFVVKFRWIWFPKNFGLNFWDTLIFGHSRNETSPALIWDIALFSEEVKEKKLSELCKLNFKRNFCIVFGKIH